MSRQVQFTVQARSAASPAAVYALLADGATWPRWTPGTAWYLARALRRFVQDCADGLAAHAGASPEASPRGAR
jgi:hypothetical protein